MQTTAKVSSASASIPIRVDLARFARGVGAIVTVPSTATVTYTLQYSGESQGLEPACWVDTEHAAMRMASASQVVLLTIPVTFVRVNVTSYSGTGAVMLHLVQTAVNE